MLLIGTTVHSWPDDLCAGLVRGGRFVVRYDLRDAGRSTAIDPVAPAYTLRDLVADAAGLLDALRTGPAHVVGLGPGGWIAQVLALDRPDVVHSLTLISTRPTAPGPADADLPEHADTLMAHLMTAPEPDWTDRTAVIDHMAEQALHFAAGPAAEIREQAGRVFDHVGDAAGAVHRASQAATVFAALDCRPRWRERLGSIGVPTLVVHGVDDPFFPVGNAHALAAEIPGARLLLLPGVGHGLPARVHPTIVRELLR